MCQSTVLDYALVVTGPSFAISDPPSLTTLLTLLLLTVAAFHTLPRPLHCGILAALESARREPFLFVHRPRFVID